MGLRQAENILLFLHPGYNIPMVSHVALQIRIVHYCKYQKQFDQWGTTDPLHQELIAPKVTLQMDIIFAGKFSFTLQVLHLWVY